MYVLIMALREMAIISAKFFVIILCRIMMDYDYPMRSIISFRFYSQLGYFLQAPWAYLNQNLFISRLNFVQIRKLWPIGGLPPFSIIIPNLVRSVMSIHLRQTAFTKPQKSLRPLSFDPRFMESQEYLRQNLGSQDRMVDAAKNNNYLNISKQSTSPMNGIFSKKQKNNNNSGSKDYIITWPQQYRKTKGIASQNSINKEQEQDSSRSRGNEVVQNLQISQNETRQLERPLEEIIESVPEHNNIFQSQINIAQQEMIGADQIKIDVSPIESIPQRPKNEVQLAYQRAIKMSQQQDNNQSESSQNIFDLFKRKNKAVSQQKTSSNQSSNIFDTFKRKKKEEPESNPSSSDSEEENIFEKKKAQGSMLRSSATEKYSLQKIIKASHLYQNYLVATQRKYIKKLSLDIPELAQANPKHFQIPKDYFFKPERVQFKKMINEPNGDSSYSTYLYLCRVNNDRTSFYFQDLRSEQLKNLNRAQCSRIQFPKEERISPHTEYDHMYQRFYLFSNKQQKILVYSELSIELLCKVPVQKNVTNPNLHFCHINGRSFLILIGGYIRVEKDIAQGNNTIQIFQVNKWYLTLKSRIIKLIIGRINPIFITNKVLNDQKFLILGGNAIAKIKAQGFLDFSYEKDINQSTNMTGISINCNQITELFDYEEHTNISNLSVKISDPFCLHSGIVLNFNNNFFLALPGSLNLFQIKIFHKEINIIEARKSVFINRIEQYQKRELSLKIEREKFIIYSIDDRGIFHISSQEGKRIQKCRCDIY